MTIKPIDLQTNMGQIHEVARNQQAHDAAIINQQAGLDKEALDKSQKADSHVNGNNETEKVVATNEGQGQEKKREFAHKKKEDGKNAQSEVKGVKPVEDDRLGSLIDIRK